MSNTSYIFYVISPVVCECLDMEIAHKFFLWSWSTALVHSVYFTSHYLLNIYFLFPSKSSSL